MPIRLVPALALLLILAGCSPAASPSPEPTTEAPQTLRTLIDAPPEAPELTLGTEAAGDGYRIIEASYLSEGLTITGVVYLPDGPGPFPGVVVVHGGVDAATFTTGSDLVREQEDLALTGHVVFAPDLRGLGGSDPDPSNDLDLNVGQTLDVVNAGRALAASGIPSLDADRIGLFGHSLGGAESFGAMVVAPEVYDVVATMSPASSRIWWVIDHFYPRDSPEFIAVTEVHGTYEDEPGVLGRRRGRHVRRPLRGAAARRGRHAPTTRCSRSGQSTRSPTGRLPDADVTLVTVEGGNHRLDPHWEEGFGQIRSFLDETLVP